jgi:hypothetical protein
MESLRRFFHVAAMAQSSGPLPPTQHGYQPPVGALATGWQCLGDGCGETVSFDLPRNAIAPSCPACGRRTGPILVWPWCHYATRASLDAQARQLAHSFGSPASRYDIHLRSLVWTHTDLLWQNRASGALVVLTQLESELRQAAGRDPLFVEAPYRAALLKGAIQAGQANYAGALLLRWLDYANHFQPGYDPNWSPSQVLQQNYRSLVDCSLAWLQQAHGASPGTRQKVIYDLWTFIQQPDVPAGLTPRASRSIPASPAG